jgi:hypothetical protein
MFDVPFAVVGSGSLGADVVLEKAESSAAEGLLYLLARGTRLLLKARGLVARDAEFA